MIAALSPIVVGFCIVLAALISASLAYNRELLIVTSIVLSIIMLILIWFPFARSARLPKSASKVFLPIFAISSFNMCIWLIPYSFWGESFWYAPGWFFDHNSINLFFILSLPYVIIHVFSFIGFFVALFPLVNIGITIIAVLTIIITPSARKRKIVFDKTSLIYCIVFLVLSGLTLLLAFSQFQGLYLLF